MNPEKEFMIKHLARALKTSINEIETIWEDGERKWEEHAEKAWVEAGTAERLRQLSSFLED